jgi:hypothetical protein
MQHDPSSVHVSTYECAECGTRIESDECAACPDCSGVVRNISVPRN